MNDWNTFLEAEKKQPYLQDTLNYISNQRLSGVNIFPAEDDVFNAFQLTPFEQVKVVIIGQDPYHGIGQAHGLAFSVLPNVKTPPSLRNIYKELQHSVAGFVVPEHGCLVEWAKQGVLLLNTVLTVEEGKAHSHKGLGWETFTERVISYLNKEKESLIFLLWGAHAIKKGKNINTEKHRVFTSTHPSPLSAHRGFLGCQHFVKVNETLINNKKTPINWQV